MGQGTQPRPCTCRTPSTAGYMMCKVLMKINLDKVGPEPTNRRGHEHKFHHVCTHAQHTQTTYQAHFPKAWYGVLTNMHTSCYIQMDPNKVLPYTFSPESSNHPIKISQYHHTSIHVCTTLKLFHMYPQYSQEFPNSFCLS